MIASYFDAARLVFRRAAPFLLQKRPVCGILKEKEECAVYLSQAEDLPKDPVMLLSIVNMKLRDGCPSLEEFCKSLGADQAALEQKLAAIGYHYDPAANQFR